MATGQTHLILNNTLLEPRPAHRNLPRLLAPTPNPLAVRGLLLPELLRLRGALLQHLVEAALRGRGHGVGLGHGGDFLARDGVAGGDFGFGVGAVGGSEGRGGQAQGAAEAERSREHCGGGGVGGRPGRRCWGRRSR